MDQIDRRPNRINPLQMIILLMIVSILAIVALSALKSARKSARDARRVSDVTQITKALSYYRQENGFYPPSTKDYKPDGISRYLEKWPTAPPPQDGNCRADQNTYYYTQEDKGSSYSLKFCLGSSRNGLPAGVNITQPKNENK